MAGSAFPVTDLDHNHTVTPSSDTRVESVDQRVRKYGNFAFYFSLKKIYNDKNTYENGEMVEYQLNVTLCENFFFFSLKKKKHLLVEIFQTSLQTRLQK